MEDREDVNQIEIKIISKINFKNILFSKLYKKIFKKSSSSSLSSNHCKIYNIIIKKYNELQ